MIYNLENSYLKLEVIAAGAAILSMKYYDGSLWNETTLQYENLNQYQGDNPYYLNSVVGPHAGRIKDGRYVIDGAVVQLEQNDRGNHLHGGSHGFHSLIYNLKAKDKQSLVLEAKDEFNQCMIEVKFSLDEAVLAIDYQVVTDKTQVINMTQHTYFNLSGEDTIAHHTIQTTANRVSELDESGVPYQLVEVNGPFDLRSEVELATVMKIDHPQFSITNNIDHVFEVKDGEVILKSPQTKIGVAISADRDYAVIYTGNYFLGEAEFKGFGPSKKHQAIAIEPQFLPNDVNLGLQQSQIVKPKETYRQHIQYRFFSF